MLPLPLINSLCATSGQDGIPLTEGDPWLLSAGGSEKRLETFAHRTASSIIVLHCLILDLLTEAKKKRLFYSSNQSKSDRIDM